MPPGGTGDGGASGDHPPTSPAWSVHSRTTGSTASTTTGSTPVSPGGVSPPSKRRPFASGMPREARLAITVVVALLIIGLVIGLIFWASNGDESEDLTPPATSTTTTAAPTTTTAPPQPTVSVVTPPPTIPATTTPPTTTTAAPGGYDPAALGPAVPLDAAGFPSQQRWEAMRQCQTDGSYTEVNDAGTHYGAYQFRLATWDELAGREYPSLVGVLPSDASPADQDRMAYALWEEFGSGRWPECRYTLDGTSPPTTAAPTATTSAPTTAPPTTAPAASAPSPEEGTPPVPPSIDLSAPPETTTTTTPPTTTTTTTRPSLPTAAQWEQLRQCESNNDYTVRSSNGTYYGAYQFSISTWDDVARRHSPLLVGVLPSEASPQEQDFLAQKLWDERGRQPWPVCGARHLPENPNL